MSSSLAESLRSVAAQAIRPPDRMTVSEWAEKYRTLDSATSHEAGPWRNDRTPYLVYPMDCLSEHDPTEKVVLEMASQIGKSSIAVNWFGYTVHKAPTPIMFMLPTATVVQRLVNSHIKGLERTCPEVRERIDNPNDKSGTNNLSEKHFVGGAAYFTTAGSAAALSQISIGNLFIDEPDRMDDLPDEGDPLELGKKRQSTYGGRKKTLITSTPTITESRIHSEFLSCDQHKYWIPCPHCEEYQLLEWKNVHWPKSRPRDAYYVCPHCGCISLNHAKNYMLPHGEWRLWIEQEDERVAALAAVSEVLEREITEVTWEVVNHPVWIKAASRTNGRWKSFHLSGLYIPHGWDEWGDLAEEFYKAHHTANEAKLRVFVNTRLAEPYEGLPEDTLDRNSLSALCEPYDQEVPAQICFLARLTDVQADRFETYTVGFDENFDMWWLDHEVTYGSTEIESTWNEHLAPYLASSIGDMKPLIQLLDTGYATNLGYKFCREHPHLKIIPIKGSSQMDSPLWPIGFKKHAVSGGASPVVVGVHAGREILWRKIQRGPDESGRLHLPDNWPEEYKAEFFRQITAESRVKRRVKGRVVYDFVKKYERNEAFDCFVYAIIAYTYITQHKRIDITKLREARLQQCETPAVAPQKRDAFFKRRSGWL